VIQKLGMPKWGLSMTEGRLTEWLVEEGAEIAVGDEIAEVETEKITGAVESPAAGVLRRRVAGVGDVVPVGGLLGVIAPVEVPDAEIDAFVEEFQAAFVPGEAEEDAGGPSAETVRTPAGPLRVLVQGEGDEVLVLLHGFGGDAENWRFNLDGLADGRTVLALDLPGHGSSTKDVGGGDLAALATAVTDVLDARGLERAHLAGHSMGGLVAAQLALSAPDRVASLALVAPAGFGEEINADYIEGFIAARTRRELKPVLQLLFADPGLVTRQLVDEVLRYKRLDGVEDALRTLQASLFGDGRQGRVLASELEGLDVPVLVIWGERDQVLPAAHAQAAPAGARVEVLSGAGHSPHMEAAGEVNRLVAEFLAKAPV
jgi:pyruvate dehydrogenase E2 component (dihydrolipoyllysine-residue acetyltransferase)